MNFIQNKTLASAGPCPWNGGWTGVGAKATDKIILR